MSCISSNFSSFFFNSLNDSSEFAKYLSNGELKFSSFEDIQMFGSSNGMTSQQQQQQPYSLSQQQQQQQVVGNGGLSVISNSQISNQNNVTDMFGGNSGSIASNVSHLDSNILTPTVHATPSNTNYNATSQPHGATPVHHHAHHQHLPANVIVGNGTSGQQTHHFGNAAQQAGHNPTTNTNSFHPNHQHHHPHNNHTGPPSQLPHHHHILTSHHQSGPPNAYVTPGNQRWPTAVVGNGGSVAVGAASLQSTSTVIHHLQQLNHNNNHASTPVGPHTPSGAQHFDGSFEFLKYLRHSNDYNNESANATATANSSSTTPSSGTATGNQHQIASQHPHHPLQHPEQQQQQLQQQQQQQQSSVSASSLIDLDSTSQKSRRKAAAMLSSVSRASNSLESTLDVFFSSNSNESSLEMSSLAFPSSHLNASNSNTSSEGAVAGSSEFSLLNSSATSVAAAANAVPKPLTSFAIKENFEVHPSHKVEEGIFQHMNKLPPKKKENLKQLGVRFTGQMTLSDKSIVVENFIKFCQEYDIKDHRPFLSLNQSGLNKPEQIKFARYLGQGLPTFTLFCIYSNFKNLFCTKRTEIYTKDGYNLPYILEKTKRFLSNTTADLKNMLHQTAADDFATVTGPNSNNNLLSATNANMEFARCIAPRALENLIIYDNFDVHETHRIEDGVCTHITRLPPKKQELLKQFGIQSNQIVSYYEKYIIIENFIKFCNEYKIADHRPFLDFHESGLPKCEQLKFVRYLGQGLPNLTLNKIYVSFKDVLGLNRIEKITLDGYNLDTILKKKKKNLYNRMHATGVL